MQGRLRRQQCQLLTIHIWVSLLYCSLSKKAAHARLRLPSQRLLACNDWSRQQYKDLPQGFHLQTSQLQSSPRNHLTLLLQLKSNLLLSLSNFLISYRGYSQEFFQTSFSMQLPEPQNLFPKKTDLGSLIILFNRPNNSLRYVLLVPGFYK